MVIRILRSALLFAALPAMALPNRVFVASTGMDVGTCPITSPCRSFSYAKQQVALDGEIIALDTAGYGIFEIDQGVSVYAAPGVTAFIAVGSLGVGIDVITGPSDAVVIRGLALKKDTKVDDKLALRLGQLSGADATITGGPGAWKLCRQSEATCTALDAKDAAAAAKAVLDAMALSTVCRCNGTTPRMPVSESKTARSATMATESSPRTPVVLQD